MKPQLILIPNGTSHPDRIITYNQVNWYPHKPTRELTPFESVMKSKRLENLKKTENKTNGKISKQASRKLRKALDYLLLLSTDKKVESKYSGKYFNFKIAFITLTLPSKQIHPDNEIKSKCLNSFLIELTRLYKVKNYIWRSELQK